MPKTRYRVSWEMPDVWADTVRPEAKWHHTEKEYDNNSLAEALDHYLTLKEWENSGEEPIRNVKLEEAVVEWRTKEVPKKFLGYKTHDTLREAVNRDQALQEAIHEDSAMLAESDKEWNAEHGPESSQEAPA